MLEPTSELEKQLTEAAELDPDHAKQYNAWADMAAEIGRKLGQALALIARGELSITQLGLEHLAAKLADNIRNNWSDKQVAWLIFTCERSKFIADIDEQRTKIRAATEALLAQCKEAEVAQAAEEKPAGKWICPHCASHDYWRRRTDGIPTLHCENCGTEMVGQHLVDLKEVLAVIQSSIDYYVNSGLGTFEHVIHAYGVIKNQLRARFGGGE